MIALLAIIPLTLPGILLWYFSHRSDGHGSPPSSDIPTQRAMWYIGSLGFFMNPSQFLKDCMKMGKDSIFSFRILESTVVVLRGVAGRDAFFSKGPDFMAGYTLLNPLLETIRGENMASVIATFTRPDTLERLFPLLVEDALQALEMWGTYGEKDAFKSLDELVFTLAARMTICREFSEDPKKIRSLISIFKRLEAGSDHHSLIFPWFPTPARIRRTVAAMQLHRMISAVILSRKDRREDDPLQAMIDKGLSPIKTTVLLATMLFAAIGNTGNVVAWMLLHLQANPKWKVLVENEARRLHEGSHTFGRYHDDKPLLSMNSIETQMPIFDLCSQETLRMLFKGPFIRRSVGDIFVDQKHIPHGTYIMFPTADLHENAAFYSTPQEFNPEHFSADAIQERRRHGTTFLGWGAGRHMCAGRRAAQMLMKIIVILLLSKFDIQIVDDGGEPVRKVPEQLERKLFQVCPSKQSVALCYEVRRR